MFLTVLFMTKKAVRKWADHPRRVIGYFTSWRSGDDPQSTYLVKDIPWEQLTHINYAFVSIGSDGKVNVGDVNDPNNPATGKTWPGVEVDLLLVLKVILVH